MVQIDGQSFMHRTVIDSYLGTFKCTTYTSTKVKRSSHYEAKRQIRIVFFKKWTNPGFFFVYFRCFQTNITIFTICEKCPSSIRCRDSNPRPSEREYLPITTRPGLPPLDKNCLNKIQDMMLRRIFKVVLACLVKVMATDNVSSFILLRNHSRKESIFQCFAQHFTHISTICCVEILFCSLRLMFETDDSSQSRFAITIVTKFCHLGKIVKLLVGPFREFIKYLTKC